MLLSCVRRKRRKFRKKGERDKRFPKKGPGSGGGKNGGPRLPVAEGKKWSKKGWGGAGDESLGIGKADEQLSYRDWGWREGGAPSLLRAECPGKGGSCHRG